VQSSEPLLLLHAAGVALQLLGSHADVDEL
jgi:hypothetical protein